MLRHIGMDCFKEITMSDLKAKLTRFKRSCFTLLAAAMFSASAFAAPVDIIYVGTWTGTGGGNPTGVGGPGMAPGQKFVIKITYDDTSAVTNNVNVLDAAFNPSGNFMTTVDLSAPGNSLDIFVPMEGLDAGSPFIYNQNETNHFDFGLNSPVPTLNFVNNSDISNTANVIGLEFEGDFFPGAGQNFIELFNTAPPAGVTSMQAQILNFANGQIAASGNNTLADAVALVVDAGPDIVYNAATLIQTATASVIQSNDLGAGRTDGEDFVDFVWSPAGTAIGDSNQVGIAASGLTMTTSTTSWTATGTEQMTGLSDSDTVNVSYQNAGPTINANAVANAGDVDFTMNADDADLAVNALIAGFEMVSFAALVDGVTDATAFFTNLFNTGADSFSNLALFNAFGAGAHNVLFTLMDKAGATATSTVQFNVDDPGNQNPIPEPGALVLLMSGLLIMLLRRRHR